MINNSSSVVVDSIEAFAERKIDEDEHFVDKVAFSRIALVDVYNAYIDGAQAAVTRKDRSDNPHVFENTSVWDKDESVLVSHEMRVLVLRNAWYDGITGASLN